MAGHRKRTLRWKERVETAGLHTIISDVAARKRSNAHCSTISSAMLTTICLYPDLKLKGYVFLKPANDDDSVSFGLYSSQASMQVTKFNEGC